MYYLGFTLVVPHRRKSRIFQAMIERVVERLVSERAICAWDICSHNDMTLSLQDNIERLLYRRADVTVAPIDRQTYYAARSAALLSTEPTRPAECPRAEGSTATIGQVLAIGGAR